MQAFIKHPIMSTVIAHTYPLRRSAFEKKSCGHISPVLKFLIL